MDLDGNLGFGVAGCCAMAYVAGFPDDDMAITDEKRDGTISHIVEFLGEASTVAHNQGKSILFATISTRQTMAETALQEAGFISTFEDWSYRNPLKSNYKTGVKVFMKQLFPIVKAEG